MSVTTKVRKSVIAAAVSVSLAVSGFFMAPTQSASAAPAPVVPNAPISADRLPTVQINGVVWSQAVVGNKVFAGGSFTRARPAGTAAGTNETVRNNLLAFDIRTGNLDTSFNPNLNGQVMSVALSPDNQTLYVVGDFTTAGNQNRRRVAAFSTATGALLPWNPVGVDSRARAVTATASAVYVGGAFSSAGGTSRGRLAAFRVSDGALLDWQPRAERNIWGLAAHGDWVYASGQVTTINGEDTYGRAKIHAVSGVPDTTWQPEVRNAGNDAAIGSLRVQGDALYGTSWHFGPGGNLEGAFRVNLNNNPTGSVAWLTDCHGDAYSAWADEGSTVYVAGHSHYCGNLGGGFPQYPSWKFQHAQAYDQSHLGDILHEVHGYPNWAGIKQAPAIVNWLPDMAMGSYTGQYQAAWDVVGNSDYVVWGGEFPRVNGTGQQGLVRFAKRAIAPNAEGPRFTGGQFFPTLVSRSSTAVRVTWQPGYDRDDRILTYRVLRGGQTVLTTTAESNWWTLPALGFVDEGLTPGATYRYQVVAYDASGNTVNSSSRTITMPASVPTVTAYGQLVRDYGATMYWPLNDERTGSPMTILDNAGVDDGTADNDVHPQASGAIPGDGSVLVGTQEPNQPWGRTYSTGTQTAPDTFTVQAWINTTTGNGGRIIGFSDLQAGNSGHRDRHVYMTDSGQVTFGVRAQDGSTRTVTSSQSYNDGQWHMISASMSPAGMVLYVDGVRVGRRADTTAGEAYLGFWRMQGDVMWGWPDTPANHNYVGGIDEVAVFPTALTQSQVAAQYEASGRTSTAPVAPTDAYGLAVWDAGPDLYWRFNETTGDVAHDSGQSQANGTFRSGVTLGAQGVLPGNVAASFDGSDDVVFSNGSYNNVGEFSTEGWFKTTTTSGGKIIGLGNAQQGNSSNHDRHTYMIPSGQVVFGVWTGFTNTITSPVAYNDGEWHHVVSTQSATSGMSLYIDGVLVGTNPQTQAQPYNGYWRVGGDSAWEGAPYFSGTIDEVAVYNKVLTGQQVMSHYTLGGGTVNQAPTASFTSSATDRRVTFTGSGTDPDGAIAAYAWNFGDGTTSSEQNPVHVFAPGTWDVTLTVFDNKGTTGSVTHSVTVTTVAAPIDAYGMSVFEDNPRLYWRLDEATGTTAHDVSGTGTNGTYYYGPVLGQPGALPIPNTAAAFDGNDDMVSSDEAFSNPRTYSLEAWFKTTSTNGGKIIGFGANRTGESNNYDRHVYLQPDGHVVFGVWTGQTNTITTDNAYNDGEWHHMVATQTPTSGMKLYLDGQLVGTNPQTGAQDYVGYWKVGGDITWGSSPNLKGVIDEVAVYESELSDARVAAHFAAAQPAPNVPPHASFTVSKTDLAISVNASTSADPDGTITGYAWDFGDGSTATGVTANHTYGASGTYTVELTVTDDHGATTTKTEQVEVLAANIDPTASFTSSVNHLAVSFDGSASSDPDGTIASYAWSFGDGSTGTGATASHTYAAAGSYMVQLTVTDNGGLTASKSETVTVTAEVVLAADEFQRTVAAGWGTADVGGAWTTPGSTSNLNVGNGTGSLRMNTGAGPLAHLTGVSARDVRLTTTFSYDKPGTGSGVYTSFIVRRAGTSEYRAVFRTTATATTVTINRVLNGTSTAIIGPATLAGGPLRAGEVANVTFEAIGASPTQLRVKGWREGTPEPAGWTITTTDSSAALQGAGTLGIHGYLSGSATNGPLTIRFDHYKVVAA